MWNEVAWRFEFHHLIWRVVICLLLDITAAAVKIVVVPSFISTVQFPGDLSSPLIQVGGIDRLIRRKGHAAIDELRARLKQQLADLLFGLRVSSLSEMGVLDFPGHIDQIFGRPEPVLVVSPRDEVVVHGHRLDDTVILGRPDNVVLVLLKFKLGAVDANDHQPIVGVARIPKF